MTDTKTKLPIKITAFNVYYNTITKKFTAEAYIPEAEEWIYFEDTYAILDKD